MTDSVEPHCSTLIVEGWNKGFNKVAFTKMLQKEFGFSLTIAKVMTDQLLENKLLVIDIADADIERINALAQDLGAIVRRDSSASSVAEDLCR
jgi:hypothetical protein